MKKCLVLLALLASSSAFAINDGKYTCTVSPLGADKSQVKISFQIKEGEVLCQVGDSPDECEAWFKYSPQDQNRFWLDGLVDGGYEDAANGDWQVRADSDGCNIGRLDLYKDSGFTKGFIVTEYHCGGDGTEKYAGKVFCKVK